jgi:uncharacterized protein (TIGR00251 family)
MVDSAGPFADLALAEGANGTVLPIRAVPRAARDALDGVTEGALRVRLAAPPVEGAANKALIAFLATTLSLPKRDLTLIAGEKGRHKRMLVRGLTGADLLARLRASSARGPEG